MWTEVVLAIDSGLWSIEVRKKGKQTIQSSVLFGFGASHDGLFIDISLQSAQIAAAS